MSLSAAVKEAYARAGSTTRHLISIEFLHSTFPSPLRLVGFDKPILITLEASAPVNPGQSVAFTGIGMEGQEPAFDGETDPQMSVRLDGVSGQLNPLFAGAITTEEPIRAIVRTIAYNVATDATIGIAGIYDLQVNAVNFDLLSVTVSMSFINVANVDFPRIKYSPDSHPSLYA
jgi:hypothetical protein